MSAVRFLPQPDHVRGLAAGAWGLILLAGAAGPAAGQEAAAAAASVPGVAAAARGREVFVVERSQEPVVIDGLLDEIPWQSATRIPLAWETRPGDNTPARVETSCLVTYDASSLYLACEASDPDPAGIRAFITDRDRIGDQDRIVFTLDPFNDARRAFEFGVSALGVQLDGVFDQQRQVQDTSWDAIWASAGRVTKDGYVIEAAIPFKSLRFPAGDGVQTWGFAARRYWPRSDQVELRSMRWDRDNSCLLCQTNLLTGFSRLSPGRNVEVTPTFTSSRSESRSDTGALDAGPVAREIGFDARWGVTSNLTLNATVNPDFSQVEADVAQLDVNNRYALFFPEKRPFFLEGADVFETPVRAVFTRTIADPTFGAKLTGKAGAQAVGVMVARDGVNNLLFPGNDGSSSASLDEEVTTTVARYRRDVGASSNVGVLYAGRSGTAYGNHVGGVDGFFRLTPALTARLQYLRSETEYPAAVAADEEQPEGLFGGDAFLGQLVYETRNWNARLFTRAFSPGFRADAGFVPQVNVRTGNVFVQRSIWAAPGRWFTRLGVGGGAWYNEDFAGRPITRGFWNNFEYEGPRQTSFWVNPNVFKETYEGETYDLTTVWSGASYRPSGRVGLSLAAVFGDAIDYANGGTARQLRIEPAVDLRLGSREELRFSLARQRLTRFNRQILQADLVQVRAVHNFSARSFIRVVGQLRMTQRDPAAFRDAVDAETRSVLTEFLYAYKVNPQTVLFVGYSDGRLGTLDATLTRTPVTLTGRTLFLKLGYAWRP